MRSSLGTRRRDDPGPTLKHFAAKGVKLFNPWSGNPDDGSAAAVVQTLKQPLAWRHAVELGTAYFRQGWRDLGHSGRAGVGAIVHFFSIGELSVSPFPQA